jgi:dTDP-L-rhamnose 4-epimerase
MLRVLITGGAGFIGSHLADELLARGHRVRALDNLTEQVHGPHGARPAYLDSRVELQIGDVRNRESVERALEDVDAVFHFAAAVGVGQSMYQIAHYTSVNNLGTAVLMEALSQKPVQRLIVASSMSIYGEGLYRDKHGNTVASAERTNAQLLAGQWDPCDDRGEPLEPLATPELKPPSLSSVYALGKYDQERLCLMLGRAYGIPTVALRFFNVYGPRQALSNPYTGVLAIFASRLLNDSEPLIFEDGLQRRDFVSVHDVKRACCAALERPDAVGEVFNIGSGESRSIRSVAAEMAGALGRDTAPKITGTYRAGDIRHCFADIEKAGRLLGYRPEVEFTQGLKELSVWLSRQSAVDRVAEARAELESRGLTL